MLSLYDLTSEYLQVAEMLADADADPQAVKDTLEAITGEIEEKAEKYAKVELSLKALRDQVKKERDRLNTRLQVLDRNIKSMDAAIMGAMNAQGVKVLAAGTNTFKITNNGGAQPMDITGTVPDNFCKVIIEPDTEKIREALKQGELPFAVLKERGTHLTLK